MGNIVFAVSEQFTKVDATHLLSCVHAQGSSRKSYKMHCVFLGNTKSGKAKVLVFGRLFWKDSEHVKAVRYVEPDRLTALSK